MWEATVACIRPHRQALQRPTPPCAPNRCGHSLLRAVPGLYFEGCPDVTRGSTRNTIGISMTQRVTIHAATCRQNLRMRKSLHKHLCPHDKHTFSQQSSTKQVRNNIGIGRKSVGNSATFQSVAMPQLEVSSTSSDPPSGSCPRE